MLDIIIVTYNAKDKLKLCLKSVERHTKGIEYLLAVVNNHSTDGTFHFLKKYQKENKNIKIINLNKNLGFSGGANLALKNTSKEFIALLDDDVEVTKGWLKGLYQYIRNKSEVGIVGGKVVFPDNRIFSIDGGISHSYIIKTNHTDHVHPRGYGEKDKGQRDYVKECDVLAGPCWLMRRELLDDVGYFDERFFPSQGEDTDYCLRTRLAGYKIIYNGKVKIIHHHLYRDKGQFKKNQQKFLKKWKNLLHKFPLRDSHPADKHIVKGVDYLEKEKFKQAFIEFKKAEVIDKRFSNPILKGIALEGMGKYDEAIQQFKKVLSLNPSLNQSSFLAHYRLALIYRKISLIKEAKREASRTFGFIRN